MRQIFREIGRAPIRIVTSVFALALAIGAIGVFAIPTVSTSSLRDAAERDGIPQVIVRTSDTGTVDVTTMLAGVGNIDRAEAQIVTSVPLGNDVIDVLGLDFASQEIDVVRADVGRLPEAVGEILVTSGLAEVGDQIEATLPDGSMLDGLVVGIGGTTFWNDSDLGFTTLDTAAVLSGLEGANRVVVRTVDTDPVALRATSEGIRSVFAANDITTLTLPETIPNGRHPIEADIDQISTLVGLLGVVAGLVALVLLASTTNTLITERTREVAIMRALGSSNREMRRRLRRLALGIAAAAVVIGVPLGIAISNFIARMILDEFVGLTPQFAVSVPVMLGSAAFALIGARLVAARAARRVTNRPLAEALRDRQGSPFGRRFSERLVARWKTGSLLDRTAVRNGVHHRSNALAMMAQLGAAVAALMVIASLATTVTSYNEALVAPDLWASQTFVDGPGLDIPTSAAAGDPDSEIGAVIDGELAGWEVDMVGFVPDTQMIDRTMDSGRWFAAPGEVVISRGFADRIGADIGDVVSVDIASGRHDYTVVGLHPDRDRSLFLDVEALAVDMGQPGTGNVLLSTSESPRTQLEGRTFLQLNDLSGDEDGTDAILAIFTAIGVIVVAVAGLAVASGLAVNVYERRHEFAALRALGGRRRHVFRVVMAELLPLGAAGFALGLVAGYLGAAAIMESFEASNAIELGFTFATGAIPAALAVVIIGSAVLGGLMVRRVTREPVAVTLRGGA